MIQINKNSYKHKIFHLSGDDAISKYEFGKLLIKSLSLNLSYINKGKISKFTERAKRSNNQTLDCTFYQKIFKRKLPKIQDTIKTIKNNIQL